MNPDPADLPRFVYEPLVAGEMRLLIPDTSHTNDGLCWTFKNVSLNSELDFDALSYTWGPQADAFPVSCNRHRLHVHKNLYSALPYLAQRRQDGRVTTQPIWIDAICINQTDDKEKFIQINLMNQIYRRARKVWVWLGLAEEQSHVAQIVSLLPIIAQYNKQVVQFPEHLQPERPVELRELSLTHWSALSHLFRNPWFSRLWVAQEAALAQDIAFLCGEHEIDYEVLSNALEYESFHRWCWHDAHDKRVRIDPDPILYYAVHGVRTAFHHQSLLEKDTASWKPLRLVLFMTQNLDCFAPHDHVFGILGLLKEIDIVNFSFDYNTSIPNLYIEFSRYILSKSRGDVHWWVYLNLSFNLNRRQGLPSWVPDLHSQTDPNDHVHRNIRIFQGEEHNRYQASQRPTKFELGRHTHEIILQGKEIDKIAVVHPSIPKFSVEDDEETEMKIYIALGEWERKLASAVLLPAEGEIGAIDGWRVTADTYWRTLVADALSCLEDGVKLTHETWIEFRTVIHQQANVYEKYLECLRLVRTGELDPNTPAHALFSPSELDALSFPRLRSGDPFKAFITQLLALRGRRLFSTAGGRFGFTGDAVQCGDLVCVLNGSHTPHVIQRVEDCEGGQRYRFVADAYVHGLMYGQADGMDIEEREFAFA